MTADEQLAKWREQTRRWRALNPEKNREVAQRAMAKYYAARHDVAAAQARREQQTARRDEREDEREAALMQREMTQRIRAAGRAVAHAARKLEAALRHEEGIENERLRRRRYRDHYRKRDGPKRHARKRARLKLLRITDPGRMKVYDRKKLLQKYGLTLEQYDAMNEAQGGLCAICHAPETRTTIDKFTKEPVVSSLAVDHNHDTGAVRDLLCLRCNNLLGLLEQDPDIVSTMYAYLAHHSLKGAA